MTRHYQRQLRPSHRSRPTNGGGGGPARLGGGHAYPCLHSSSQPRLQHSRSIRMGRDQAHWDDRPLVASTKDKGVLQGTSNLLECQFGSKEHHSRQITKILRLITGTLVNKHNQRKTTTQTENKQTLKRE